VFVDGPDGAAVLRILPRFPMPDEAASAGSLAAPMPGSIVRLHVAEGDAVTAGQSLLALEAMKMEHQVHAPVDGVIVEIMVAPGDQVDTGQALLRLDDGSSEPA
jgi:propionyl-CoA carboxylase alpha chain